MWWKSLKSSVLYHQCSPARQGNTNPSTSWRKGGDWGLYLGSWRKQRSAAPVTTQTTPVLHGLISVFDMLLNVSLLKHFTLFFYLQWVPKFHTFPHCCQTPAYRVRSELCIVCLSARSSNKRLVLSSSPRPYDLISITISHSFALANTGCLFFPPLSLHIFNLFQPPIRMLCSSITTWSHGPWSHPSTHFPLCGLFFSAMK